MATACALAGRSTGFRVGSSVTCGRTLAQYGADVLYLNPVHLAWTNHKYDALDYKALSNAGTWMIGRLQTERDVDRLRDGLQAASGSVDVEQIRATIAGLAKREFVPTLEAAGRRGPAQLPRPLWRSPTPHAHTDSRTVSR